MTASPLDRAARALDPMAWTGSGPIDTSNPHGGRLSPRLRYRRERSIAQVRAVLAALAEPSPEMVEAGADVIHDARDPTAYDAVEATWRAMLAKAGEG